MRITARCSPARELSSRRSSSFARHRQRPSQPNHRSTIQRRGSTSNPFGSLGWVTISRSGASGIAARAWARWGPRYPPSAQTFCKLGRVVRSSARTAGAPSRSGTLAGCTCRTQGEPEGVDPRVPRSPLDLVPTVIDRHSDRHSPSSSRTDGRSPPAVVVERRPSSARAGPRNAATRSPYRPWLRHRYKSYRTVEIAGKPGGSARHWQPLIHGYRRACTPSRRSTSRGRPVDDGAGSRGSRRAHSASVRSLSKRSPDADPSHERSRSQPWPSSRGRCQPHRRSGHRGRSIVSAQALRAFHAGVQRFDFARARNSRAAGPPASRPRIPDGFFVPPRFGDKFRQPDWRLSRMAVFAIGNVQESLPQGTSEGTRHYICGPDATTFVLQELFPVKSGPESAESR